MVYQPQLPGAALTPDPRTLIDVLRASAAAYADAPALDDGKQSLATTQLRAAVQAKADELRAAGLGAGHKVGIRISSGSTELYVGILAVLAIGAAYVPVDADDPQERADLVFGEAKVAGILSDGGVSTAPGLSAPFQSPASQPSTTTPG